jgi:putative transposase
MAVDTTEPVTEMVLALHLASGGRYGSPRLVAALARHGVRISRRAVMAIMKAHGLSGNRPDVSISRSNRKNRKRVSRSRSSFRCGVPDAVRRRFKAGVPGTHVVMDLCRVETRRTVRVLAFALDLGSRRVLAWHLGRIPDTANVLTCLRRTRATLGSLQGVVIHSDRGGEFANRQVRDWLGREGAIRSMSRRGNCWDNAVAESFVATLRRELWTIRRRPALQELESALRVWIHWYNTERLHSSLGYRSPAEWEEMHAIAEREETGIYAVDGGAEGVFEC